jgi:hypothetical protein
MARPKIYGAIVIDPAQFLLLVNSAPIIDWPATGVACELTRTNPVASLTPAFGDDAIVPGTPHYNLAINVVAGSISDNLLEQFTTVFETLRRPWVVSASRGPQPLFFTIFAVPTGEAPISWSLDNQPSRQWNVTAKINNRPSAGIFVVRQPLTAEDVRSAKADGRFR